VGGIGDALIVAPGILLVFRSFLALSLVRGPWGHAGDAWFVDLGV
jgi:hypothetical protein